MRKQLLTGAFVASTLAIATLVQTNPAEAAAVACTNNILGLVTNTTGCQYVSPIPQTPSQFSVAEIKAQNFFGFTDWTSGNPNGNGVEIPGSGQSGTWNIGSLNLWQNFSDVMLVFKDGRGTSPVAYKLVQNAVTGQWSSPFRDPPFDSLDNTIKDVSNITVYYRGTPVPTPALLPGLIGMGFAALRKKKQAETAKSV